MKKTRTKNRRLALEKFETRQLLATLELLPSADAALYEDSAGTIGNGTGQYLFAGRTNQGQNSVRRGLIRFDLQSIPDGAVVNSVALTLNASRINDPSVVSLHRLTSDWTEGPTDPPSSEGQGAAAQNGDATWVHNSFSDSNWNQAGGDFDVAVSASQTVDSTGAVTFTSAQMAADVTAWLETPTNNFGWLIQGDESTSQTAHRFDSKDSDNLDVRPELVIDYSMPEEVTATELEPVADAGLYESPTGEFGNGSGQHFFAGRTNQGSNSIRRGLLRFDLQSIPANAIISNVTLTLNASRLSAPTNISLHSVSADWTFGTSDPGGSEGSGAAAEALDATWLHSSFDTDNWTTAGGDFNPSALATTAVDATGAVTFSSSQLIDEVSAWVSGSNENFGWLLQGDESAPQTSVRFDSGDNPDANVRPQLSIEYTLPTPPVSIDGEGNLLINGTDLMDRIVLQQGRRGLMVRLNDQYYMDFNPAGDIIIDGGAANDNISVAGNVKNDVTIYGGTGKDRISAGRGNDVIFGEDGNDTILAGGGNNFVDGGLGNDVISTRDGNDILVGGLGNDRLQGGSGFDLLIGGMGSDRVSGGKGKDILIGGTSTHESSPADLAAILLVWADTNDNDLASEALRAATPGLLAGDSVTVDDDARDILTDRTGRDWFFASIVDADTLRSNRGDVIDSIDTRI